MFVPGLGIVRVDADVGLVVDDGRHVEDDQGGHEVTVNTQPVALQRSQHINVKLLYYFEQCYTLLYLYINK